MVVEGDKGVSTDVTIKLLEKWGAVETKEHRVTDMEEDEVDTMEDMTQTEEPGVEVDTMEDMTQTEEPGVEVDTMEDMTQTEEQGVEVDGEATEAVHIKVGVITREAAEVADTEEIEEEMVEEDTTPQTMEDNYFFVKGPEKSDTYRLLNSFR